ncbi:MAG: T9SS type A sorting domain-containing protein [FCB group bacterium]
MKKNLLVIFALFILALLFQPFQSYAQMQKMPIENYIKNKDTLPPHPTWWRYCSTDPGPLSYDSTGGEPIVEDWPQNSDSSNLASINMNQDSSYNFRSTYKDFVPGKYASTSWNAWVHDPTQDARFVVTFSDEAGNDSTIVIRYYAFKITARPDLDFGTVAIGDTVEKEAWFVNESTTSNGYVVNADFKFKNQGFELVDLSLPQMVPLNDSIKIKVRFVATHNGEYIDTIGTGDTCWFNNNIQVKAKVGAAKIDVSDYNFGDVPLYVSEKNTIHIQNTGSDSLIITGFKITQITGSYNFNFEISPITLQSPLVLVPGQKYDFKVDFIPIDTVQYIDTMFFYSNSEKTNNPDSIAVLNGRGVNPNDIKDNNLIENDFTLFPNPVEDNLTIQYNTLSENISLKIFNVYGNLVDEIKSGSNNQKINHNTSRLANGLYFVQLNTGKKIITKTFVVLR